MESMECRLRGIGCIQMWQRVVEAVAAVGVAVAAAAAAAAAAAIIFTWIRAKTTSITPRVEMRVPKLVQVVLLI